MIRVHNLKSSILTLLVIGLLGSLTASAQLFEILPVNHVWKYSTDCHDGDNWQTPGYDDSAWSSGPGGFTGGENNAAIVPILNTTTIPAPNSFGGHAVYFRTHFTLSPITGVQLVLSNAIDDAAVIYLNGTSIATHRIAAGAACATFGTGAPGAGTEAVLWEIDTRTSAQLAGILQDGDNVLAVQVHQNGAGSSDLVFGLVLMGQTNAPPPPPPISFTNMAGPVTFDTAPPVEQWSTRGWAGGANGIADTQTSVDAAAQMVDASTLTVALTLAGGNPPGAGGTALYASDAAAQYAATRPTGTLGDLLMATLTNNSGGSLSGLSISYTLNVSGPVTEEVLGHLVYYSLSGAPNTWVLIPDLSNQPADNTTGTYSKSAILDFGGTPWAANTKMYFLWADDNGSGSPDTAYGIDNVKWSLPAPPHITSCTNLTNQTVLQCRSSDRMSVIAEGGNFQWVHNGVDIPGATSSSYTIANMQPADAGTYTVRVFNSLGSTSCPPATVTYQADTVPPTLVTAVGSTNLFEITLTFNESINTNNLGDIPFNFMVMDTNTGGQISISNAVAPNSTTLILQTEGYNSSHGHSVKLSGVEDSCAGNLLPDTTVPVHTIRTLLLPLSAIWRYDDTTDTNPIAPNWAQPGYDDSVAPWKSGAGVFDAKRGGNGAIGVDCRDVALHNLGPVGTCIALSNSVATTNITTFNFRTHFTYGGDPAGAILELRGKVDDGAVVYLNGAELQRIRMAAAPTVITRSMFATTTVNDGDAQDVFQYVAPAALLSGNNLLAVELHQVNGTSSDATMGLQVEALTTGVLAQPPHLTISYNSGNGTVTISWNPAGGTLQSADNLGAPSSTTVWTTVAGATSPYTIAASGAHKFYRVVQ